MNKAEKYVTMFLASVGAATGVWAKYHDYSESEFTKPITLREAKVDSFKSQIASARDRGDTSEALRVTLEYERYEESWRKGQTITSVTERINNLESLNVTPEEKSRLQEILGDTDGGILSLEIEPEIFGSAHLAVGNFSKANKYYQVASIQRPSNPSVLALRSLAVQGEAFDASTEENKKRLMAQAMELSNEAISRGVDRNRIEALLNQLKANQGLQPIVIEPVD